MQKTLAILLVLLASASCLHAQATRQFSITHYTNENGLPQNSIKDAELDKNGFLWLATEGGLARFDGQKFRLYDREHFPVLASNRIIEITLGQDGGIYFIDEHGNAYGFDRHYQPVRISGQRLRTLTSPPGQIFLKLSKMDVSLVNADDGHVFWTKRIPDMDLESEYLGVYFKGKLYYWSAQGGINAVDQQGNVHKLKLKGVLKEISLREKNIPAHKLITHNEKLYVLSDTKIYQISASEQDELMTTLALATGKIDRVQIYREYPELNLKVVGSLTDGLYLFKEKDFRVATNNTGYQNFYAQAVFQDSGVVTHNGIIFPSSSHFHPNIAIGDGYRSLPVDSRKHYWANATYGLERYILELDSTLEIIRKIPADEAFNDFIETTNGELWFAALSGERIGKLTGNSIRWLNVPFPKNAVRTFLPESDDVFWIAGYNTLAKLNVRTGKQRHFKDLESFIIERLYLDQQKVLWIGTSGNGFFALKNDKIYPLPLDKNGYLKNTHSFLEDKSGFMWMSTNNGLFRCKKADLLSYLDKKSSRVYYQYFNKESGFNTNEFNGNCNPSAVIFKDGKFSLPSLNGLVQFYPDSIGEESPAYHVFIDRLSVDGREKPLKQSLILEPSFKYLEVALSAPFYGHPDNQLLEYNLSGFDNSWNPVRKDNIIALNTLTYGDYTLKIRKRSGFSKDGEGINTSLSFTVKPFFYQTWPFKLGLLAIMLAGVWLLIKVRYAYLINKNKQLEEEVNARTTNLRNANRLKEKMLLMVSHDLQSPLHFLGYLSQLNYDALHIKQNEKASEISLEIKNTAHKIFSFVEEFKLWARVQDEAYNLKIEQIALIPLLEELRTFFKELFDANDNKLLFDIADGITVEANRTLLKATLRNILDNANKNTRNGTVKISCFIEHENEGTIVVTDTGDGMSSEKLQSVKDLMVAGRKGVSMEPDGSLGFQFITDFSSRMDALLEIRSIKGKGTAIYVKNLKMYDKANPNSTTAREFHKRKPV